MSEQIIRTHILEYNELQMNLKFRELMDCHVGILIHPFGVSVNEKTKSFIDYITPHMQNENFSWEKKKKFSLFFSSQKNLNFPISLKKTISLKKGKDQNHKITDDKFS